MVQSKADREKQKLITDKCQSLIEVLLKDEDNKYCVDCDAKGPRWASWNLGIFLCIRCAGIHRNLGVHISKVKSVNLDAWTPEHVAYVQRMGNSRARAIYEANLPDDFRRPQSDTALESFIRAKYEHKRYIAQDYVDPGPPQPAFNIDEELKKMKEQKRNKLNSSSTARVLTVPELPNPKPRPTGVSTNASSIESPNSVQKQKTTATNKGTGALADLLDLDLSSNSGQIPNNTMNLFDIQSMSQPSIEDSLATMATNKSSNICTTNPKVSANDNRSALDLLSGVNLTSTGLSKNTITPATVTPISTTTENTINSSFANFSLGPLQPSQQTASNKNSTFEDPFGDLVSSKLNIGTTTPNTTTNNDTSTISMPSTTSATVAPVSANIASNQGVNLSNLIDF